MQQKFDIAVVGGGASGLAAALAALRRGREAGRRPAVAVVEKNPRVGKKLLMTGNGRCNLTNRNAGPARYHGDAAQAAAVLEGCTPQELLNRFRALGLFCRELEDGRLYPYSLQASAVLNVLRRALQSAGGAELCGLPVESVRKSGDGFTLSAGETRLFARRVIVATGGKACPQSGSSGDGYALLAPFGHSVTGLRPALVQIRTEPARTRSLHGVRCEAGVLLTAGGRTVASSRGEVQFAQGALSGICIFDLSRYVDRPSGMELSLDLAPEFSGEKLADFFAAQAKAAPACPAGSVPEGLLPKALAAETEKAAGIAPAAAASAPSAEDWGRLAATVKRFRFPVLGTLSWQNAQVTAGGIPLAETDGGLQSRKCAGIYLCGEILNLDGGCGGYNLHWAWASGIAAGHAAADSLTHVRTGGSGG